jgi:hypothetical protein
MLSLIPSLMLGQSYSQQKVKICIYQRETVFDKDHITYYTYFVEVYPSNDIELETDKIKENNKNDKKII